MISRAAPAKINLALVVGPKRPDGLHEVATLLQRVDLADTISLETAPKLTVQGFEEDTLVSDALVAVAAAAGVEPRWRARIEKRIPVASGLGGGSSDAATTLLALNELWACRLSLDELASLALPLGADVPVFIQGSSAWAEGVGERLTPVRLAPAWYVILYPGVGMSTREVFQSPELTRNSPLITIRAFFQSGGRNDCEPVVRARSPEIAAALDWLAHQGDARLTGTGSCVFAVRASAADAERLAARVPDRWMSFVARGLDTSPVHALLGQHGQRD